MQLQRARVQPAKTPARAPHIEILSTPQACAFHGDTQIKIIRDQNVNQRIYEG